MRNRNILLFVLLLVFSSSFGQAGTAPGHPPLGKIIRCVLQDRAGNYWFGSEGEGVCRYNGKTFTTFTKKDGLCSNFIREIQEDKSGNIWFSTRDGICRYDGNSFTSFPQPMTPLFSLNFREKQKNLRGNLWFSAKAGAYRYDGSEFSFFAIPFDSADAKFYRENPGVSPGIYSAYCIYEDRDGNIWFGTEQRGVCKYDGKTFSWIRGKGLDKAAVRCIYQDKKGMLWFMNNGLGVCRYDGKTLTNFTEEKGLANAEFMTTIKGKMGTLARAWSITEEPNGTMWLATVDAGVWRYDGKTLINYTTRDGLSSNTVWAVYKDRANKLWFGTEGGVCTFNGKTFNKFPDK